MSDTNHPTVEQQAAENRALVDAAVRDGGGCFSFHAIPVADFQAWVDAANQGDPAAATVVTLGNEFGDKIMREAEAWPVVCGLCGTHRLRGTAFVLGVAVPLRDDPSAGLSLGLCPSCSEKHPDPRVTVMKAFEGFMPGLRCITVHPGGGRA